MNQRVEQRSEKFQRQRKMLLLLPFVVAPLLAVAFYGLGGGKGKVGDATSLFGKGLNMNLPEAKFDAKKKVMNKLGIYRQADRDSARLLESRRQDPYYGSRAVGDTASRQTMAVLSGVTGLDRRRTDAQAAELMERLAKLKEVINAQPAGGSAAGTYLHRDSSGFLHPGLAVYRSVGRPGPGAGLPGAGVGRREGDPDLDKLNAMLDKVMQIQHPGQSAVDTALPVQGGKPMGVLSGVRREEVVKSFSEDGNDSDTGYNKILEPGPGVRREREEEDLGTGFISLDGEAVRDSSDNVVAAVIARDQTVVTGATVELRLEQEAVINGVLVPRGSPFSGKVSLSGERLMVNVSSIRKGNAFLAVNLEVYDLDGLAGIRAQGSINRDASKESAGEAVGSVGMTSFDPSLGGQAAAAGMQAARTLLGKKIRLVRVNLNAGYHVFLRNVKK